MSDDRKQAIPFDYAAHPKALDDVRRMIASARKRGLHREVADLEKDMQAAQKALAEFDAVNVREVR
jgi:hypothetical protein